MMNAQRDAPVLTAWRVEITHGMMKTEGGLLWGWGWICYSGHEPEGIHGYTFDEDAYAGLQEHFLRCSGDG